MSRIGKNPVNLPEGIKVKIEKDCTKVKGPNGELEVAIHSGISVSHTDNKLIVERSSDERKQRSVHGTIRQLLANAVTGVSEGFSKELELIGVGYQASNQGNRLQLQIGFLMIYCLNLLKGFQLQQTELKSKCQGLINKWLERLLQRFALLENQSLTRVKVFGIKGNMSDQNKAKLLV